MKFGLVLCVIALIGFSGFGQVGIMSYNIRYDTPNDNENWWEHRKVELVELLEYYSPDFIGIQEAMPNQSGFIAENLESYDYIGHGRDGIGTNSEGVPLFYNAINFKLLDNEVFWLSETPEEVSKGWDAALNRIVVYGVFENKKTGDILHIFNCHFDHLGEEARTQSAELMMKVIAKKQLDGKKVILMGDLNSQPFEEPIKILSRQLEDSYNDKKHPVYGPVGTFSGFDTEKVLNERIDYIFTRNIEVKNYRSIDDRRKNNLYPSDHLPVMIIH